MYTATMLQQMPPRRYYNDIIESNSFTVRIFSRQYRTSRCRVRRGLFDTPRADLFPGYWRFVSVTFRRGPPGVKSFSRVGHQDAKRERITSASSWVDSGLVRRSGRLGFLVSSFIVSTHTLYLYTHHQTAGGGRDRGLMARPFVPPTTHRYIYYIIHSVFPSQPFRLCVFVRRIVIFSRVKTKGIYFPPPVTASHHIIYIASYDFLPSNNNSSTSPVSGYESSCFLFFFFSHTNVYIYKLPSRRLPYKHKHETYQNDNDTPGTRERESEWERMKVIHMGGQTSTCVSDFRAEPPRRLYHLLPACGWSDDTYTRHYYSILYICILVWGGKK